MFEARRGHARCPFAPRHLPSRQEGGSRAL